MKKFIILMTALILSNADACPPDADCSPPGFSLTYGNIGKIKKIKKYDEVYSWYISEKGQFLLPKNIKSYDLENIKVSKYEKWFCVEGIPGYCAPLKGIDGKLITEKPKYEWPKYKN